MCSSNSMWGENSWWWIIILIILIWVCCGQTGGCCDNNGCGNNCCGLRLLNSEIRHINRGAASAQADAAPVFWG